MTRARQLIAGLLLGVVFAASAAHGRQAIDMRALARDILAEQIAFETVEGAGQTVPAAKALARRLLDAGFPETDVHIVGPSPALGNLVVRLRGSGQGGRPILLMAHLDVVPAGDDAWGTPPFKLVERDGYYYGRGTVDNKAGVATIVANMIRWKREGWVPSRDLIGVITADEETAQDSIAWLLRDRRDLVEAEFALNTDAGFGEAINGVPTTFLVQAAEKVYLSFRLTAVNPGGHSSLPRPDNAINQLVAALARIAAHRFPVRLNDITREYLRASATQYPDTVATDMRAVAAQRPNLEAAERLSSAYPLLNAILRTTCVATQLDAGHAENALPTRAEATINCRIFPGDPPDDVEATLARVIGDAGIQITRMQAPVLSPPSLLTPDFKAALDELVSEMFPTARVVPVMETGATDGLYTRNAGIRTYGVAAIFDAPDDVRAHGLDERVGVEAFHAAVAFWDRLLKRLAGK